MSYIQLKGRILVIFQFVLLGLIVYKGRKMNWTTWQAGLVAAGIFIAIWAVLSMRKSKLRINPVPDPSATLVSTGIYKWIRHPMYLSLILIGAAFTGIHNTFFKQIIFLLLIVVLVVKLLFEEKLLHKQFPQYEKYCKSTYRLIPFIF
jgi:protein-S-isoprenylcysteine O-methyltransferase Ste14